MTEMCCVLAVFFTWLLGAHILLIEGIPYRDAGKEDVSIRKDVKSTEPDTFEKNERHIGPLGAPIKYEIVSQAFVEQPQVKVSKDCGDDDDCEQGSRREDRIPIKELIPALEKESKPPDTFSAEESSETLSRQGKDGVTYEIISKSMESGDKKLSAKECDDEDECGTNDDVFSNDGSGDIITRGFTQPKNVDGVDVFTNEKAKKGNNNIKYVIISQSTTSEEKKLSRKECDDEDECGSADDVFSNDGSGDTITRRFSQPRNKDDVPVDVFTNDKANKENNAIRYVIISQSTTSKEKESKPSDTFRAEESSESLSSQGKAGITYEMISKSLNKGDKKLSGKECDDEDECGSADDVFVNEGSGDIITRRFTQPKNKDGVPVDVFTNDKDKKRNNDIRYVIISQSTTSNEKESKQSDTFSAEESSESLSSQGKTGVTYEIISKSMESGDKKLSGKECDDEDECGSADDVLITRGFTQPKNKDGVPVDVFTNEKAKKGNNDIRYLIISQSTTSKEKKSKPPDTFNVEESSESLASQGKAGATYEIISKSMESGDKKLSGKECDSENECGSAYDVFVNEGSGDIITRGFSQPKNKESKPSDSFSAEESSESLSSQGKAGVTYEIISKSMENGEKKLSGNECDIEDECGSADDVFSNDGSGDIITKGFTQPENKNGVQVDVFTNEKVKKRNNNIRYVIISQSTTSKEKESTPSDSFSADESSESLSSQGKTGVTYELISKSMENGEKKLSGKECDDEDECGSADDVFSNEGSGDIITRGFTQPKNKNGVQVDVFTNEKVKKGNNDIRYVIISQSTTSKEKESRPSDAFSAEESSESLSSQGKAGIAYEIISKSMENGDKKLSRKECDDEDECGSADDVFSNDGSGDIITRGFIQPKNKESKSPDTFSVEESPESLSSQGKASIVYEIVSKSMKRGDKKPAGKECDDEDECGSADDVFSNDDSDDIITRGFTQPKNKDSKKSDMFNSEESSESWSSQKAGMYEIISQSMERGDELKIQDKRGNSHTVYDNIKHNPCVHSPCQNDGECIQDGKAYSCLCKGKYCGRNCSEEIGQKPISFHKKSYVRFSKTAVLLKILQSEVGVLSFSVKTKQSKGLLIWEGKKLHQNTRRYASIGLTVGFVSLSFNIGTGIRKVYSKVPVNNGVWHSITIERRKDFCVLIVDEQYKTKFNLLNNGLLMATTVDFFIGGIPNIKIETQGLYKTGFKGCLKDLQVNSEYLNFDRDYVASQGIRYCGET